MKWEFCGRAPRVSARIPRMILVGMLIASAIPAIAQTQNTQTQNRCRDIAAGGFVQPDETIVQTQSGWVACRAGNSADAAKNVKAALPTSDPVPTTMPAARAPHGVQPTYKDQRWNTPRVQVAAGYQYNSFNVSTSIFGFNVTSGRVNTNGGFAQVLMNLHRYVSPVGNVDISYKSITGSNFLLFTYLGGVQAYPLSHRMWSPFGRFMLGAGTAHVSGSASETGFSWQLGGGLDWKPRSEGHMALRLGTFDYARWSKNGVNLNSLKVGAGIVF